MPSKIGKNDVMVTLIGQTATFSQGIVAGLGHSKFGLKHAGRYPLEIKKGQEYSSDGCLMNKEQIIDRVNDLYVEKVSVASSGLTVRDIEEPLSRHRNRGSAKPKS